MNKIKDSLQNEKALAATLFIALNASLLYILYFIIKNIGSVFSYLGVLLSELFSAFSPLFIGIIIAYLISPLVDFIDVRLTRRFCFVPGDDPIKRERIYKRCYLISTLLTIILIFSSVAALVCAFAVLIAGTLHVGTFGEMITAVYGYFTDVKSTVWEYISVLPDGSIKDTAMSAYNYLYSHLFRSMSGGSLLENLSQFGSAALSTGLGIIVSIYILKDKSFFKHIWRKALHIALPQKQNAVLTELLHDIDGVLSMFIRGAVIDALIVALLSSIALSFYGLPLSVFVGCFAGITNVIPYFGPLIGMVPAFAAGALTEGFGFGAGAVVILFIVQQFDCNFIYPKVVGSTTGLHPLFILLSVSVMGYFGGIVYMILAVPLAGIISTLITKFTS